MAPTLPKLSAPLAPLLPRLELAPEIGRLLSGLPTAADGALHLEQQGLRAEAVRLVAHALPKREAVWWACMCAESAPGLALPPADAAARAAAEAWVRTPGDETLRYAAWDAAQKTTFTTAEAWAAMAAFWSGPSMAPRGQPVVPPGDNLTGLAVGGAVVLASVRTHPERADQRLIRFLASARDIAGGGAGRLSPEEP